MKILVTGGAGFIGHHLVNRLLHGGHGVTIYDNFSNSKKDGPDGVKVIEGDVRDAADVQRAMRDIGTVFHLAAISGARDTNEDTMYSVNFIGSKNVFEAAKAAGAKIIFASSAAVYGDTKLTKETDECKPINQYGKGKLRAEKICPENAFVARMFNVYGPNGNSVINRFCGLIPKYGDVPVHGHGTQTRDFVYIDDVVNALVMGLGMSGTYNVGTGKETSLLGVIDIIHDMTKSKPNLKFLPAANEIQRSRADTTKISTTEWYPKVELVDGIRNILQSQGFDFSVVEHLK